MTTEPDPVKLDDLDWIPTSYKLSGFNQESLYERNLRKFKANPLIPLGCLATVGAFVYGVTQFIRGNSLKSNYGMRARVGFQLFTILACTGGAILSVNKER